MKRKLLLVLAFIALPGFAYALGLGKLQLNSALNQPFDARIELLGASANELDSLNVGLADTEAFRRAKIDRPFVLTGLKFEVIESENGSDYIHITSRDAIREPFLNFLLETNWNSGRLYREYTVLLDPPLYDPNAMRSSSKESYRSTAAPVESERYLSGDESDATSTSSSPTFGYSDNEYGPTDSSDTLWSIASRVRPDSSVSVQQMMLALLRANPEAFIDGNINGLKRGQILAIPEQSEIDSLSNAEAVSEVNSQNSTWPGASAAASSASLDVRADSMDLSSESMSGDDSATEQMIEDDESELRLVAASSDGAGTGQSGGSSASGSSVDLTLANEQLQTVTQENVDLKDRVQEAETIINDLKRLIALKDDELAALQQQMAGGGVVEQTMDTTESFDSGVVDDGMDVSDEAPGFEDDVAEMADGGEDVLVNGEVTGTADDTIGAEETTGSGMDEDMFVAEEGDELVDEMSDETMVEDDTDLAEETAAEIEPVEEAGTDNVVVPPPAGIVDQALAFIMGNLIVILGALGALILVIVALLFISRRKQNAASEAVPVSTTEFPDFEDAEGDSGPSEVTAEAVSDAVEASEEETVLPGTDVEEQPGAEDVVEPGEAPAVSEAAPEPEPEEDPLAEVNVLIAYEQFDQAEEFVRDAINNSPERADFHSKLLEVFYAANDKKKYEEAAQVLSALVNSEGPHWEMAQAMWQEMSPNRALFEEGEDEPADAPAESGGGMLDITAEDDESAAADASVDFDLGMDAGEEAAAEPAAEEDDVLDITSDADDISVLDVTAAVSVDESTADEDLLDVTSAVGLQTEEPIDAEPSASDDDAILDITAGVDAPAEDEDILDISHGGGDDLLDVTANANLEEDEMEEDLLDVTSAGHADADGEELQELPAEAEAAEADDNSLDFDIGGLESEETTTENESEPVVEQSSDDNSLEFDIGAMDAEPEAEVSLELEAESPTSDDEFGLELDAGDAEAEAEISLDSDDSDDGLSLDLDSGEEASSSEPEAEISLDIDVPEQQSAADDGGVEFDLSLDADMDDAADEISLDDSGDDAAEIDLSMDDEPADAPELETTGSSDDLEIDLSLDESADEDISIAEEPEIDLDFDLEIQEDSDEQEIDMDGTVEMPKLDLDKLGSDDVGIEIDDDDDDDDDEDHTVFVPRAGAADEQSAEDEIATKLDLAKAYVELGDKDSAKGILDEVMADGTDEQKQTAQDLLDQLS